MAHPLDLMDAFALLDAYGIPVARTQYVDSAENAIVFANTRPIELHALVPTGDRPADASLIERDLRDPEAIRRAFHRLAARLEGWTGARIVAQATVEPGSEISVIGEEGRDGRVLRLVSGAHTIERRCPIAESEAESMLGDMRSKRGLGSSEKAVRTIAHLLVRAGKLYEETGIERMVLHVRVHDNHCTVTGATADAKRRPHVKHHLEPHAHDRKSFDYHPSGHQ